MDIDSPPLNGSYRDKFAWALKIILAALVLVATVGSGMLMKHESKIVEHDVKITGVESEIDSLGVKADRIESKLDRLIERR